MSNDPPKVSIEMEIPFYDLDPAQVVWFGNFYKYFDRARAKLMDSIDLGIEEMRDSGYFWPVIESKCKHIKPLKMSDRIQVHAELADYEHRLKIYYLVKRVDNDERVAKGHTVQVAVDADTGQMQLDSPPIIYKKLGIPYPEESTDE